MKTLKSLNDIQNTLHLYSHYRITITLNDWIMGGIPKSPDVIENWIAFHLKDSHRLDQLAAKTEAAIGLAKPDQGQAVAEHQLAMSSPELTDEQMQSIQEYNWCGFHHNADGLYLEGRCIKAMLKESANILRRKMDLTALKARVAERLFVSDYTVSLGVNEPSGSHQGVVHAMTPQGKISALSRTDYVTKPKMSFTIKILDEPLVDKAKKFQFTPMALLELLLDYSTSIGVGAKRSQGFGRFTVDNIEVL